MQPTNRDKSTTRRRVVRADHHRSSWTLCAAVVMTIGSSLAGSAAAADNVPATPRVRSSDQSVAALIDQASQRSPALRSLVARIEAADGMVYVEPGKCSQGVPACLLMWMDSSRSTRWLRVVVDPRRLDSSSELIGAIGHELQHVLEVLAEPTITNGTKMYFFYRRHASTSADRFETAAATHVGDVIRAEWRGR